MTEPVGAGGRGRVGLATRVGVSRTGGRVGGADVAVGGTGEGVNVRDEVGDAVGGRVAVADGIGVGGIGVGVGVGGAPQAIATLASAANVRKRKVVGLFITASPLVVV